MSVIAEKIIKIVQGGVQITDIHVKEGSPIYYRTPHGFKSLDTDIVHASDINEFLELPSMAGKQWRQEIENRGGALEIAHSMSNNRVRVSAYTVDGAKKSVTSSIRLLPLEPPPLEKLGVPPALTRLTEQSKGLILITGPTGSGKTTTLASLLDNICKTRHAHVLTIEQPVEYILDGKKGIITQREVPSNVGSFTLGLREALRQRTDVIAIGEVLDKETVDTMLHAADSGHLVLATLHTRNCEDTINRLLSYYTGPEMGQKSSLLASTLIGIVSQTLVPAQKGDRVYLASEVLVNNTAIAQLIRESKTHQIRNIIRSGSKEGMQLLNQDLVRLMREGAITLADAKYASYEAGELQGAA